MLTVKAVEPAGGGQFRGVVRLGFDVPDDVHVQRAETYVKQGETQTFPRFYRIVDRENGRIFGYGFEPAAEGSTLTFGYDYELVSDYKDMTKDDHRLSFYLFRSEAEAEACILGVSATNSAGETIGVLKHKVGRLWCTMMDHYEDPIGEANPIIRSFVTQSGRVSSSIQSGQRRKAG